MARTIHEKVEADCPQGLEFKWSEKRGSTKRRLTTGRGTDQVNIVSKQKLAFPQSEKAVTKGKGDN